MKPSPFMSNDLKFLSAWPRMTVDRWSPIWSEEATSALRRVSLIPVILRKKGFSSVGLRCSRLIWPVTDSIPLTTDAAPLAIWMLSSHCPGM